jgi:DNA-binding GntR family transcriptional regulator
LQSEGRQGVKFESMRSSGLVERIRDELHRAIVSGRLAPGSTLTESVIATEMEVSRAPVREALRLLEESGLVDKTPNRPYRVAEFAESDLVDLASMRIALEELAVRLAVGADPDLGPAHLALEQMRAASDRGSTFEIIAADRAFHEALILAAGNPRLTAAYTRLRDQIQLALLANLTDGTSVLGGIHERHVDLLDRYVATVRGGDPAALLPLLEEHIAAGMGVAVPAPWPTAASG